MRREKRVERNCFIYFFADDSYDIYLDISRYLLDLSRLRICLDTAYFAETENLLLKIL